MTFTAAELENTPPEILAGAAWQKAWRKLRKPHQIAPPGDWTIWLLLAGRGAGKTRTAAEQIGWTAYAEIEEGRFLVSAPTASDVRDTCFEGDSGLLRVIPPECVKDYNRSLSELILTSGSIIKGIAASEPNRLRGGQWHGVWGDEVAAWEYDQEAFDMIMMAMRLGKHPRMILSTTPRPTPFIRSLLERAKGKNPDTIITTASTYANIENLAPTFRNQILQYAGTKLGRQEIEAEVLDPEDEGIIRRDWFKLWPAKRQLPAFEYIVVSLDTAFTEATRDKKKGEADPTACAVWGLFHDDGQPGILLLDCWTDHLGMPELIKKAKDELRVAYGDDDQRAVIKPMFGPNKPMNAGRKPDLLLIEDKGSGISLRQMLAREGVLAYPYNPGRASKIERLHGVSHLFAGGYVWVVESDKRPGQPRTWAEPLIQQVCSFTGEGSIRHDDLVDATTQALRYITDRMRLSVTEPMDEDEPERKRVINPYAA